jgi:predicted phage tail protein
MLSMAMVEKDFNGNYMCNPLLMVLSSIHQDNDRALNNFSKCVNQMYNNGNPLKIPHGSSII